MTTDTKLVITTIVEMYLNNKIEEKIKIKKKLCGFGINIEFQVVGVIFVIKTLPQKLIS